MKVMFVPALPARSIHRLLHPPLGTVAASEKRDTRWSVTGLRHDLRSPRRPSTINATLSITGRPVVLPSAELARLDKQTAAAPSAVWRPHVTFIVADCLRRHAAVDFVLL
jgi:hypothetical protein